MEIEQYLYDLNDSGDAIVAYSMISKSGAKVQLCNMGASVLSFTAADGGEILKGCCSKGLVEDKESFEERLWESRVEVNRVVMSLAYECEGVGVMAEVIFDFDDDDSFEVTYQACLEGGDAAFDLTHRVEFGEGVALSVDVAEDGVYAVQGAQRGILSEVATASTAQYDVAIISSHPALYFDGASTVMTLSSPAEIVAEGVRFVQKSLFRPTKR